MTPQLLDPLDTSRVVVYHQTHHVDGAPLSPAELLHNCPFWAAIVLDAIHVNTEL
ncbi:hypothetical protein ACQR35_06685 [Pseudarthrobacter sp. J1738]|uniref:hypothetical protein n=1 Tax=Pseudarthrobacter sp. J1738 TaxID=3420446 RepID=UPI003D264DA9